MLCFVTFTDFLAHSLTLSWKIATGEQMKRTVTLNISQDVVSLKEAAGLVLSEVT